jgi:hypothetical protein
MSVEISLRNDKAEAVTGVVITDRIPEGCALIAGSVKGAIDYTILGGEVNFEIGELAAGDIKTISFSLQTPVDQFSQQFFYDGMENGQENWSVSDLNGTDIWRLSVENPRDGGFRSWFIPATTQTSDQALRLKRTIPLDLERPVLRFYHDYDIQPGLDGGIVEISTNGLNWVPISPEQIFRNSFTGRIPFQRFGVQKQKAFWGNSQRYVASYIDLSTYKGKEILFRFRYGSDEDPPNAGQVTDGWFIDDIEVMDMFNYETEACATTSEGDLACTLSAERGTVVESKLATPTSTIGQPEFQVSIFPNPVTTNLNVSVQSPTREDLQVELQSLEGKVLQARAIEASTGSTLTQLDLSTLPKGIYLLKIQGRSGQRVEKIIVQ